MSVFFSLHCSPFTQQKRILQVTKWYLALHHITYTLDAVISNYIFYITAPLEKIIEVTQYVTTCSELRIRRKFSAESVIAEAEYFSVRFVQPSNNPLFYDHRDQEAVFCFMPIPLDRVFHLFF